MRHDIVSKEFLFERVGDNCSYITALKEYNGLDESPVLLDESGETVQEGVDVFDFMPSCAVELVRRMFAHERITAKALPGLDSRLNPAGMTGY